MACMQVVSYRQGAGLGSTPVEGTLSAARKRKRGGAKNRQKWVASQSTTAVPQPCLCRHIGCMLLAMLDGLDLMQHAHWLSCKGNGKLCESGELSVLRQQSQFGGDRPGIHPKCCGKHDRMLSALLWLADMNA